DVALDKLFIDVCVYNGRVMGPQHVENVVALACRRALVRRGVSHVTLPVDVQSEPMTRGTRSDGHVPHHVSNVMARAAAMASEDQLARAAAILNGGNKTVIRAGRGSLGARDELLATAERLSAPIVKPLLGKAAVPDDSPFTTGGIGLLCTRPSQEA